VFVDVCLRREWNGCVVTQMCLFVCVSGGNGMNVLLHRCVCMCVSQEGMEWM